MTHDRSRLATMLLACGLAACTSAPVTTPRTGVHLEPIPQTTNASGPLPALPPDPNQVAIADGTVQRVQSLSAVNQDLPIVLRELALRFGLQYEIDPEVHGTVNATLRNTTLPDALRVIVPQGMTYQISNGVLRVAPARIETKIFSLDYVALSRVGTASTVIQRRLGQGALGAGSGASGGADANAFGGAGRTGADVISATSIADVWEEIRVAMEALVFSTMPAGGTPSASSLSAGLTSIGGGARPYSRTEPDGRRLIVNPIAGQITVSALPAQLAQVETFIRTFETSIQRQVLIEAKIVEVNLDHSFEFGIDWNVVTHFGTTGITTRSAPPGSQQSTGNVQFTLSGGAGQITAVLNALSSQGEVKVLSSPRVSALNNQRAVFDVTTGEIVFNLTRQPIVGPNGSVTFEQQVTPTQVNVGIVLDVLPQIGADNTVTMNIRPVVTSVARTATFTSPDGTLFQAPVIDTRESDTMARLRAGETIIIGGLMQNRREKTTSGVPGLRSIPLLGKLFTHTTDVEKKAELVIFLTPTIIAGQPPADR
jgi:MSHA biogenesis protein MshL